MTVVALVQMTAAQTPGHNLPTDAGVEGAVDALSVSIDKLSAFVDKRTETTAQEETRARLSRER